MDKQDDLIINGINISSLRQRLETSKKCAISTEEWFTVLNILEKLYRENKHLKYIIDNCVDFTEFMHTYDENVRLQQKIEDLESENLWLQSP